MTLLLLALLTQDPLETRSRGVLRVAVSPDGKLIATSGQDYLINLWDVAGKKQVGTLTGHDGDVNGMAFSPDGKTLVAGDLYKHVRVWDVAGRKQLKTYDVAGPVTSMGMGPDGRAYFGCRDGMIYAVAAEGGEPVTFRHENEINGVAVTPDGKKVVGVDGGGVVIVYATATAEIVKRVEHGDKVMSTAISPDGKTFATGGGNGSVKLWDLEKVEAVAGFSCPGLDVNAVAFTPDGKSLVLGTFDGLFKVVDAKTGAERDSQKSQDSAVSHLAVSPDGKWAVTSSMEGIVKLWTLKK
ncbi:MAG TPA: WD40 repeat domain-containing protein [Planctomycetota bacterium]